MKILFLLVLVVSIHSADHKKSLSTGDTTEFTKKELDELSFLIRYAHLASEIAERRHLMFPSPSDSDNDGTESLYTAADKERHRILFKAVLDEIQGDR